MKKKAWIFLALFLGGPALGWSALMPRRVLALYKTSEGQSSQLNNIHHLLEQPLETLGVAVDYYDIDQGLPAPERMGSYLGIITFFNDSEIDHPAQYADWIEAQIVRGRRVVIFGDYGAFTDRTAKTFISYRQVNRAFMALGLRYDGFWTQDKKLIKTVSVDKSMTGFEEPIHEDEINTYVMVRSMDPANKSYLVLSRKDMPQSESSLIVVSPNGGFAASPYLFYSYRQADIEKRRWHLDPYKFLEQALGLEKAPRLQASFLNGNRLWLSHVDGDGFLTPIGQGRFCGDIIDETIFHGFNLPITVSFIMKEVRENPAGPQIIKKISGRKNIVLASHTDSHPMDWSLPNVDIAKEVQGSLEELKPFIVDQEHNPPIITWSGICNPPAKALALIDRMKGVNMNGYNGDGGFANRFDALFPSRSYLSPAATQVDGSFQFNHRSANDFSMTSSWDPKMLSDYRNILETFENIKEKGLDLPFHVYFHFYSGQTAESLAALQEVFHWSANQSISPVHLHEYAGIVKDFREAKIYQRGPSQYVVQNSGWCRTIFFPHSGEFVDMGRSTGVVGYKKEDKGLTVYLDGSTEHRINLMAEEAKDRYALAEANGWIESWLEKEETVSFVSRGLGLKKISVKPPEGEKLFRVKISGPNPDEAPRSEIKRLKNNLVHIEFEGTGENKISIEPVSLFQAATVVSGWPALIVFLIIFPAWFLMKRGRALS